jgi:hypothetical protein
MFTLRLHDIYMTFTLHLNLHLHLRLHWITLHTFTFRLTLTHTGHYIALHFHLNRKCVTFHLHSHFKNFPKSTFHRRGQKHKANINDRFSACKTKIDTHTLGFEKNTSVEKNLLERTEKWKKKKSPTFSTFLLTVFLLPILHVQCVFNYSSIFEICQLCQTFWNLQKFALKFAVSEICEFDQKLFIVVQTDFKKNSTIAFKFSIEICQN